MRTQSSLTCCDFRRMVVSRPNLLMLLVNPPGVGFHYPQRVYLSLSAKVRPSIFGGLWVSHFILDLLVSYGL